MRQHSPIQLKMIEKRNLQSNTNLWKKNKESQDGVLASEPVSK